MLVRHGIMLVGPTGGGKTVSRNILQKALSILPTFLDKTVDKQKPHLVRNSFKNFCLNLKPKILFEKQKIFYKIINNN